MSLKAIVHTYISSIRPLTNDELKWFQSQPNLSESIKYAGLAINSKGKRYSHQRRIRKGLLPRARNILYKNREIIQRCANFDELLDLVESLVKPIKGIGELYIYDTSLRIGAKLNMLPDKIYLHTGTRDGAKALGFNGRLKYIDVSDLPYALQKLEPYEIEDVLCIFKDKLKQTNFDVANKEFHQRSCYR